MSHEKLALVTADQLAVGDVVAKATYWVSTPRTEEELAQIAAAKKKPNESVEEYLEGVREAEKSLGRFAEQLWCHDVEKAIEPTEALSGEWEVVREIEGKGGIIVGTTASYDIVRLAIRYAVGMPWPDRPAYTKSFRWPASYRLYRFIPPTGPMP